MLSKEDKLKYGEMLRQQMKEKEDRKRMEDNAKRGFTNNLVSVNIPKVQSDRIVLADPSLLQDPKQLLQKKLETQDYNPFGKAGGGAPNRRQPNNITANQEGSLSSLMGMTPEEAQYFRNQSLGGPTQPQHIPQTEMRYIPPQQNGVYENRSDPNMRPQMYQGSEGVQYQKKMNESNPRQNYQQYMPSQSPITQQRKYQQNQQNQQNPYQQSIQRSYNQERAYQQIPNQYQQVPQRSYPSQQANQMYQQRESVRQQAQYYPPPPPPPPPIMERLPLQTQVIQRSRTLQNEDMQEMYKRGGRNLLKLENETMNEHLVKQKQKMEMQNFLKQQMEEADRRKQEEKDKLKREEIEEERRNKQYIEIQNRKLLDDEKKKNQEKQKIVDQNLQNIAKRRELEQEARDKLERERTDGERRRDQHQRERQRLQVKRDTPQQESRMRPPIPIPHPREEQSDSVSSTTSQQVTMGKGFNTNISKEYFRKQRQKQPEKYRNDKKLQLFTAQIQKMRDQINNQGDMFQKQIQRIKREAENANQDKRKAQIQIQKLKLELQRKNKESQFRLMQALQRNDPYIPPQTNYRQSEPQYYQNQQNYNAKPNDHYNPQQNQNNYKQQRQTPPTPPKPMAKTNKVQEFSSSNYEELESFTRKQSSKKQMSYQNEQYEPPRRRLNESVMTLQADSKKIPLSLPANQKLTMSKIQNYGKESFLYGDTKPSKNIYREESIPEEMEERVQSRKSQRQMDELDRLVDSRAGQNKWEMSTVKDDITKEIEELLKKKDNKGGNQQQSYNSQMSQAGRQVLSRGGLPYQGPNLNSLNSNKASLVSNGTLDVDRVYERNQARLRQLRALGVQTINTTNDQDLNRLNALLKNYH